MSCSWFTTLRALPARRSTHRSWVPPVKWHLMPIKQLGTVGSGVMGGGITEEAASLRLER
jgi:hypothetical protein